jgi:hypothetical protein
MFRLFRLLPTFLNGHEVTSGCSSFCPKSFTGQEVARGRFRTLRMFRLFRLLHKLSRGAKFSGPWQFQDVQAVQACTQTSPDLVLKHLLVSFTQAMVLWKVVVQKLCPKTFSGQEVARGRFRTLRMFRLFRLLRKLSRGAKFSGTWQFQDVQAVQACTQTSPDLVLKHLLVSFTQAMVLWEVAFLERQ